MKLAYLAVPAAAAAVIGLAACSSSTNPGPAANLQACKDFAAFKAAVSASEFPAVTEHTLDVFLTNGPRDVNTNVGEPLRHDLASITTEWREVGYANNTDIEQAAAACAVVKSTDGQSSSPPGSKTAAQILPAMKAAMTAASSVHVVGTVSEGSQKISIDANFNGSGISGTFSESGSSASIVVADGKAYVQLNSSNLQSAGLPATDCSSLCGKYVQAPATDLAQLSAFSLPHLMSDMVKAIPSDAGDQADLFEPATFEGHPVLQLMQAGNTIDVARTGTPYPLFISSSAQGSTQGSLTFSEWNSVPRVTPPAASQILST